MTPCLILYCNRRAWEREQEVTMLEKRRKLSAELTKARDLYQLMNKTTGWKFLNDTPILDAFKTVFGYYDPVKQEYVDCKLSNYERQQYVLDHYRTFFDFGQHLDLYPKKYRLEQWKKSFELLWNTYYRRFKTGETELEMAALTPFNEKLASPAALEFKPSNPSVVDFRKIKVPKDLPADTQ